jgi:hypothetical protein
MSRQRGRREPPKPEKEAYVQSLKQGRRQRAQARAQQAASVQGPMMAVTVRRRWAAVAGATFFIVFAFGALLTAIVETEDGNTANARLAMILAAFLSLFSLAVLGVVSRGPRPLRATLATGPAAIGVYLLLAALLRDPATPLVAAFGLAGAFTLRPAPGGERRSRIAYVLVGSAISGVAYVAAPAAAITMAPIMPYFLLMAADMLTSKRAGVSMDEVIEVESIEEPGTWDEGPGDFDED